MSQSPAPEAIQTNSASAVWFPRAGVVEIVREDLPALGSDQVRIRALASGVSQGSEMLVYRGQVAPDVQLDLPSLKGSFAFPIKYGYASVGRVVEIGLDVNDLATGDLVFSLHPHQTQYAINSSLASRLPPGIDPEIGVFLANLETAVNVMLDAHPRFGSRIVIFGQGIVGLLLTQLARRAGASQVITIDPFASRRELSMLSGADAALSPGPELPASIRKMTRGAGADLVLEASGNPSVPAMALECVTKGGAVVICSWYGAKPVPMPLGAVFHRGRLRVISSQVGSLDPSLGPAWSFARRTQTACGLLRDLILGPLISHRIPFSHAAGAYRLIDQHPEETAQVVLTYSEDDV